jgi:hypothetical protein
MRVLIGLAALAVASSSVNAQSVSWGGPTNGIMAVVPPLSASAIASITVQLTSNTGAAASVAPALTSGYIGVPQQWVITVPNLVSSLYFTFGTNQYTGQVQYRWSPNYPNPATAYPNNPGFSTRTYTCDACAGGTPVSCNTSVGPGGVVVSPALNTPANGYMCANLIRTYTFSGLAASTQSTQVINSISVQLFDIQPNPAPNTLAYSFIVVRSPPPFIVGDPQIVGMQGQDFQVHGMPDEVFNMVTYPTLQVNARFTYLESAECHDNFTACFAHPGTYITEEGIRVGKDKVRVTAGSHKKGLTVSVNGKKVSSNVDLKQGAVELVSHRRVVVHTNVMKITISNSDKFMNQELELNDDKLVALGSKRRTLKDNERFHAEVPLHGLQGQTWRNVEYPSGLDYEGSITDYHVVDGNLFGTDFVFNHFEA